MSEKLYELAEKAINEQEGIKELRDLQNYLNRLKEILGEDETYNKFVTGELGYTEYGGEETDIYKAFKELTRAILKDCCNSKAAAEYIIDAEKKFLYQLSSEVQASKVYEKFLSNSHSESL